MSKAIKKKKLALKKLGPKKAVPTKKRKPVKKPVVTKPVARVRNFKATDEDWKTVKAKAKRHAGGNLSLWLRHAAMYHSPKQKDLTQ